MKVLKRGNTTVKWTCPACGSLLELEKKDIHWYRDYSNTSTPYIKCCVCEKETDVEGDAEIRRKLI